MVPALAMETIVLERDGAVATVRLNRPNVLNALNLQMLDELSAAFAQLDADDAVRAVILTGTGPKAFAAGADIAELNALPSARAAEAQARKGQSLTRALERMHVPVIAAVNGFALGGGCELAMACDIRIVAGSASFGQPEVSLGIIPGFGGTQRLPRLVGEAKALEMNLTGDAISAGEAYELGLVDRVVPDHELLDTALAWARKLAGQAPLSIEQIKRVSANGDLDAGIDAEKRAFATVFASEDAREGIAAFLQKRTPHFKGK